MQSESCRIIDDAFITVIIIITTMITALKISMITTLKTTMITARITSLSTWVVVRIQASRFSLCNPGIDQNPGVDQSLGAIEVKSRLKYLHSTVQVYNSNAIQSKYDQRKVDITKKITYIKYQNNKSFFL